MRGLECFLAIIGIGTTTLFVYEHFQEWRIKRVWKKKYVLPKE